MEQNSARQRKIIGLPHEYTVVPVSTLDEKSAQCPSTLVSHIDQSALSDPLTEEYEWLERCRSNETCDTWAGHHSKLDGNLYDFLARMHLLSVLREKADTMAMMEHGMGIVMKDTKFLNPVQTPVLVCDQPLFRLCKLIQWLKPDQFGEDKIFILFGGLHIEKAALQVLGDWLDGSGWTEALVKAGVTTQGRAESMVSVSMITRTRYAHQVLENFDANYSF